MGTSATIPDHDALKRVGEQVCRRLSDDPSVYRVPAEEAELFAVGDFLTASECNRLCGMIDKVARPSALFDKEYGDGFRTSYSGDLDPGDALVRSVTRRIDDLLGLSGECGESVQGQRYLQGQEFKPHNDWFYTDQPYWQIERERGGQRSWTTMVFLNEVPGGGGTQFTELGIEIEPRPGVLLAWNNALPDGSPNESMMHAGTPVTKGAKYIVTRWYRTRKWN